MSVTATDEPMADEAPAKKKAAKKKAKPESENPEDESPAKMKALKGGKKAKKKAAEPSETNKRQVTKEKWVAMVESERERLIKNIIDAHEIGNWAGHARTKEFMRSMKEFSRELSEGLKRDIEHGEKPVSTSKQMLIKGKREGIETFLERLELAADAIKIEVGKAHDFERKEREEVSMFYFAAPWDMKYLEEAQRRMAEAEKKSGK